MTKEEIIKLARALCTDFKCESDIMVDFCNSIIRELEQEPVLDKIKAEIDAHRKTIRNMADIDDWYAGRLGGHDCDIEIIDKYKAESEDKE